MKHDIIIQHQEVEIITLFRKVLVQVKLLEGTESEQNERKGELAKKESMQFEEQTTSRKQLFALISGKENFSDLSDLNSVSSMLDTEESKDTEIDDI